MASEWVERAIGDLAEVIGGSTPPTSDPSNFDGEIPWLTPKDLSAPHERYICRGGRNITRKGLASCAAQMLPTNTVLLSSRAPIGYLAIAANPIATNQGFRSLVVKSSYDHEFIYYWLAANIGELERHASGSTFRELSGGALRKILVRVPSALSEQRAIARILGALDDKIELNRQMGETLEAIARALFKSWFVDLDPVRAKTEGRETGLPQSIVNMLPKRLVDFEFGEIPEGWRAGTLLELAFLNPEAWTTRTRPDIIKYVDLSNTKWGRIDAITPYESQSAPSRAQRVLRLGDTIVGTVRPGNGSYALISEDGLTGSTGFAVLRPRRPEYVEFVYLAATAPETIEALSHLADGAAYPAVRPEVVAAVRVFRPPDGVIHRFSKTSQPLLKKIGQIERENKTLTALRDELLPKLVSGELRIRNADRFIQGQI